MNSDFLSVSESFYSLQGEGPYCGVPAVFLRLGGCNLQCRGFSFEDPVTGESWGCDTGAVWRQATRYQFDQIIDEWAGKGWLAHLSKGAHLVITGGEPTLHQLPLMGFFQALAQRGLTPFIELETNATILLEPECRRQIHHINASPKLQHSGESREKAYQPLVLESYAADPSVIFKFVVASAEDVAEIQSEYEQAFSIPKERLYLMPEGGSLQKMQENHGLVAELCKEGGYRFSPRLHIYLWDTACGV